MNVVARQFLNAVEGVKVIARHAGKFLLQPFYALLVIGAAIRQWNPRVLQVNKLVDRFSQTPGSAD